MHDLSDTMTGNVHLNVYNGVCVSVYVQSASCLYNVFGEDAGGLTHKERKHVVCFRARGLLASFFILSFLFHISLVVQPLKVGHLSRVTTPPPTLQLDVSPLSDPSLHFQCLALKGRKNAKPAQISVIISFTGTGLMSQGGPGFTYTKGRVKS